MDAAYGFAYSAQGYNHIKANKICQDSSGCYFDDDMVVAVVADGHGSSNYPRTDRGSRFAVEAAIAAIRGFVAGVEEDGIDLSVKSDQYFEQLAKSILASWYAAVEADLAEHPFTADELADVKKKYSNRYLAGERCEKAYGTTLIAVCQTSAYWFGLQIGDGKCVCISLDGTVYEPIPWDEDCQANVTTSICDTEAIDEFRYCYLPESPVATFVGTDGIDDSYSSEEELHNLYRGILSIFAEHGREVGEEEVCEFLPSLSRRGSGDDASIAGVVPASLDPSFTRIIKAQAEYTAAASHMEKSKREFELANEKLEYVTAALEKARAGLELAKQKRAEAQEAIVSTKKLSEAAFERFEAAIAELEASKADYEAKNHIHSAETEAREGTETKRSSWTSRKIRATRITPAHIKKRKRRKA